MKINNRVLGNWLVLGVIVLLAQCKSADDPLPSDENEQITKVNLLFKEDGTSNETTFTWSDPDGEGGNPAIIQEIILKPNTVYTLELEVLDETKNPVDDITQEIMEEADEHLFVFTSTPASLLSYAYMDEDDNGFSIGLVGKVTTTAAGTGNFRVQLRHQAPVNGVAVKDGTAGPGSDDVNISFVAKVQ